VKTVKVEWIGKTIKIGGVDVSLACRHVSVESITNGTALVRLELFADLGGVVVESEEK
jgi:hypothetical protein